MAADDDKAAAKSAHSTGFMSGFAPWIVYWILSGNVPFATAILVAFALSVLVCLLSVVRHQTPKVLEIGNAVAFVVLAGVGLVAGDAFVGRWIQPLGNGALLLIMVVSVLIGKPFVVQYVGDSVPAEQRTTPGFLYVSNLITWVWVVAMGIMTAMALIPPIVQGDATMNDGGSTLSIVCYWVIPFTCLGLAMLFSLRFPDWLDAEMADPSEDTETDGGANSPATPSTPPTAPIPGVVDASGATEGALALTVVPADSLLDEPLAVQVRGAGAGAAVTVRATAVDLMGQRWQSEADFAADAGGTVDTSTAGASGGTYEGVDPDGLVWSMGFRSEGAPDLYIPPPFPSGITIEATTGGRSVTETVVRRTQRHDVVVQEIHEPSVVGRLYAPAGDGPFPGIALFGGSEGGIDSGSSNAALLASHGYAALVVGYFALPGLPDQIVELPLERLADGVRWLSAHDLVGGKNVSVMAISRGSEATLAMAANIPDLPLSAMVAIAPSQVAWQAMGDSGAIADTASWTVGGQPVPWLAVRDDRVVAEAARHALRDRGKVDHHHPHLMHLLSSYAVGLEDAAGVQRAALAVERIAAPLLLLAGDDDQVWPSAAMGQALLERRRGAGLTYQDQLEVYASLGHLLRLGIMPTTVLDTGGIAFGGTPQGTAVAQADATSRVLTFLRAATA